MRDMILLVLLSVGCLYAIRAPWIGAIMWTVVSLASPHIAFGYSAASWPVAMLIAASTGIGLLFTRERQNPFSNAAVVMMAVLAVWITITLPFSLEMDLSWDTWDRTVKIFVMLIVTVMLLNTPRKLDVFIWANVAAIGYYGVKGGIFSILTGGNFLVLGAGGFIAENNGLALAEIVILPLIRYQQLQATNKWMRRALGGAMVLVAISTLGSHSRGALLGMIAMFSFFWLKSGNKIRWGVMFAIAAVIALVALPDEYWQRMNTIQSYDSDGSAQGRINSWWLAYNVANDRITGGGFRLNVVWIFATYAPNPKVVLAAHSIYFQMLGEQGYIGLMIFLSIGALTWLNAHRMIKCGKAAPELTWALHLGQMIQVSMIGYAVCGAFLSLALFDLPYNVMAISALGLRFAKQQQADLNGKAAGSLASATSGRGVERSPVADARLGRLS